MQARAKCFVLQRIRVYYVNLQCYSVVCNHGLFQLILNVINRFGQWRVDSCREILCRMLAGTAPTASCSRCFDSMRDNGNWGRRGRNWKRRGRSNLLWRRRGRGRKKNKFCWYSGPPCTCGLGIREKIGCGLRFFGVFLCGFAVFGSPYAPLFIHLKI